MGGLLIRHKGLSGPGPDPWPCASLCLVPCALCPVPERSAVLGDPGVQSARKKKIGGVVKFKAVPRYAWWERARHYVCMFFFRCRVKTVIDKRWGPRIF